jgi:hypothetical protein
MSEMIHSRSADRCIISCGMFHPELTHLVETGFLNPRRILFTPPGLHALPEKLEEHLLRRLAQVRESCPDHEIIVVYGKKCHASTDEPRRRVHSILEEVRGLLTDALSRSAGRGAPERLRRHGTSRYGDKSGDGVVQSPAIQTARAGRDR